MLCIFYFLNTVFSYLWPPKFQVDVLLCPTQNCQGMNVGSSVCKTCALPWGYNPSLKHVCSENLARTTEYKDCSLIKCTAATNLLVVGFGFHLWFNCVRPLIYNLLPPRVRKSICLSVSPPDPASQAMGTRMLRGEQRFFAKNIWLNKNLVVSHLNRAGKTK